MGSPVYIYLTVAGVLALMVVFLLRSSSPSQQNNNLQGVESVGEEVIVSSVDNKKSLKSFLHPLAEHANHFSTQYFQTFTTLNRVFSPLSLAYTLSVLQLASNGTARDELSSLLLGQYTSEELRSMKQALSPRDSSDNSTLLDLITYWSINANHSSLAALGNEPLKTSFLSEVDGLCVVSLDDHVDAMKTIHKINTLFSSRTNGHISSAAKVIRPTTSSVLINSLYFQANWKQAFPPTSTRFGNFTRYVGSTCAVPMLRRKGSFPYYASNEMQHVELPVGPAGEYALGIVLERLSSDGKVSMPSFNFSDLSNQWQRLKVTNMEVVLPKFKQKRMIRSVGNLRKLGVKAIFEAKKSSFPLLSDGSIYLTEFIHEIIVTLDELGFNSDRTSLHEFIKREKEAAALLQNKSISTIANQPSSVANKQKATPGVMLMQVDHTFVYYLRHLPTNTLLFLADFDCA
eukprot:gene959-1041_t